MACKFRYSLSLTVILLAVLGNCIEVYGQEFDESYKNHPLIQKGDSLRITESWSQAIGTYAKAEMAAKNEENWEGYIYAINQAGYCYRRNRQYSEARVMFDRVLKEGPELLGNFHPEIARTYYHLGYYYYYRENISLDSSLWAREKSIEINEKCSPVSLKDLASSYYALAGLLNEGYYNHFEAIELYEKALSIRQKILSKDHPDLGKTYAYLGYAYYFLDDHLRAQIYYQTALDIFNSTSKSTPFDKYSTYNNLGISQLELSEDIEAIRNIKKSSEIISKRYGTEHWRQIRRYNNLGIAFANIGKLDSAKKYINWAFNINLADPDFIDTLDLADSYSHLGTISMLEEKYDSAIYFYQRSNSILPINDLQVEENYSQIARINLDQGHFKESVSASLMAIRALEPDAEDLELIFEDPQQPIAIFQPLHLLAKSHTGLYEQTQSPEHFLDAINSYYQLEQLKDHIRNAAFSNESKYEVSNQFLVSASEFMDLLSTKTPGFTDQEINEIAFEVMERNRYSELFRNVVNIQNSTILDVPDSLLKREKLLASQISVFHNMAQESDSITTSRLLKYEREYQEVKQALNEAFPSYYESKFGKELIDLKVIQSNLGEKDQILEYFWGDSLLTILSISKQSSHLQFVPITDSLEPQIIQLLSYCSEIPDDLTIDEHMYSMYEQGSYNLYDKLVKPLLNSETEELIIIPDGPVSLIPFEALLTKVGNPGFYNAPFLIRDTNVRYGYSCNLLYQKTEKIISKRPNLLAMAFSEGDEYLAELDRKGNSDIPGSGLELTSIRRIFKKKEHIFLYGNEATENAFKSEASDFEILHLAVHGIGDTTNAYNSHLVFQNQNDNTEDGRLYAHELYALDFNRLNLVVLSSCKTGIGKEYPGEGIFSMARGFRYSGASTTVMSLWDVADNTTAEIMELFYSSLSSGEPVSNSLRLAKLEFLDSWDSRFSHPAYWAAFVSIGQEYQITFKSNNYQIYFMAAVILSLFILGYILLVKKGKIKSISV